MKERRRFHLTEKRAADCARRKLSNRESAMDTYHVLALYSSPTSISIQGRVYKIPPQQQLNLTKEMRSLVFNGIPDTKIAFRPACSWGDAKSSIEALSTKMIYFCGHGGSDSSVVFQDERGLYQAVEKKALTEALVDACERRKLECVFLNACDTSLLGEHIASHAPRLKVVCWEGKLENNAGRCFANGFFGKVGYGITDRAGERDHCFATIEQAFDAGTAAFEGEGFSFGDPDEVRLTEPQMFQRWGNELVCRQHFDTEQGRYHAYASSCQYCNSPYHGQPVMFSTVDGKLTR
jgi:hypothetical protein